MPHDALLLAIPVTLFFGVALVVVLLAFGKCHLNFDEVTFPVHGGAQHGVTLLLCGAL